MSDNNDDSGMFTQLKSMVEDSVPGAGSPRTKRNSSSGTLTLPTNEDVIEDAVENVVALRQRQNFDNHPDIDEEANVPVELDIADPHATVEQAENVLRSASGPLLEKLDQIVRMEENSVSGSDIDTMLYVVEEDAGEDGDITLLGGGESLLRNVATELNLTPDERELVVEAHAVAARRNGYDRHLLLDSIAFVPSPDTETQNNKHEAGE